MPLRPPTEEEAEEVIFDSLGTVWEFEHEPGDPNFLEEIFSWTDILAIPPVNKTWLHTHTLVATYLLDPDHIRPSMNRNLFFDHVGNTDEETVSDYRQFLLEVLTIREVE